MYTTDIVKLIDNFVNKLDISVEQAKKIEVAIDDMFPDDEYMQDIVVMLASYRPGGGDYLYDEEYVTKSLLDVKEKISLM